MSKNRLRRLSRAIMNETGLCSELSVSAGREVLAHGARAIVSYSESEVKLRLCDMTLSVKGCDLTMKSYFGGVVRVSGRITGLDFEA